MHGSINSQQKCPKCGVKFQSSNFDSEGFICLTCSTRPTRYYLDLSGLKLGQLYSDPLTRQPFKIYSHALDVLMAINRDVREAREKGLRFKIENWRPKSLQEKLVKNLCNQRLQAYETELANEKKSKTRVDNVKKAFKYIVPYFGENDIRDIDAQQVEAFYLSLVQKGLSSRYIDDILSTLKSLFLRYRSEDLPEFPFYSVIPALEKQVLGLSREIAVLDRVPDRHGFRIAIIALLRTGMRINEIVAIKKHNLVDGYIVVDKAISDRTLKFARKAGEQVFYRVTPELWSMLETHSEAHKDDDFVFSINGRPLTTGRLYKVWKKACSDAGVKHISLQQASRHSTATRIFDEKQKEALQEIQRQLGHENNSTGLKHYVVPPNICKN